MIRRTTYPTGRTGAWPDDFVALDGGRLRVRRDYAPVFESLGWTTLDAVMTTDLAEVVRTVGERDNCRLRLPRSGGGEAKLAYLKRHRSRTILSQLAPRAFFSAPGIAEANAVGRLQRAGVPTMQVIAAGHGRGPRRGETRSFFLSEAIEDAAPADDFWRRRFGPPNRRGSRLQREAVLAALADTARALHQAGLFHRDFYWCHFFVGEPAPGRFEARLIDLQRVGQSRVLRARWLLKDLAQFLFSAPSDVTRDEWRFWYRRYLGKESLGIFDRLWRRLIEIRAFFYRWKEARK